MVSIRNSLSQIANLTLYQAPIRPTKTSTASIRSSHSSKTNTERPRALDDPYAVPHQQNKAFTKAHRRHVKHATLISRLQRTAVDSRVKKRRRPSQKLATDLAALGDALPESLETTLKAHGGFGNAGKITRRSLRSRPGAMKRKEKLMMAERARFDKNLALLAFGPGKTSVGELEVSSQTNEDQNTLSVGPLESTKRNKARWTAIREHISRTMETVDRKPTSR